MIEVLTVDASYFTNFVAKTGLGDADYLFDFHWNTRDSRWYVGLSQSDGTVLCAPVPIVVDCPLMHRIVTDGMPAGVIMAIDITGRHQEIEEQEDLGVRVLIVWIPEEDA